MKLTVTLYDSDENTQEAEVEYELEQDFYDSSIFWIIYLKVLTPVSIECNDIETDVLEAVRMFENKFVKMATEIEVEYLKPVTI